MSEPRQGGIIGPTLAQSQPAETARPLDSWATGQAISARKLQQPVDALNALLSGVRRGSVQSPGRASPVGVFYEATESAERTANIVKARRIETDGTPADEELTIVKAQWYTIAKGDFLGLVLTLNGDVVAYPVAPLRYLYFQQGADSDGAALDMPANTKDFFSTHILDRDCEVIGAHIFSTAGTYTVGLKIGGVAAGASLTNATAYPYEYATPLPYEAGQAITLGVTTSSGVEGFEAIFSLRFGVMT